MEKKQLLKHLLLLPTTNFDAILDGVHVHLYFVGSIPSVSDLSRWCFVGRVLEFFGPVILWDRFLCVRTTWSEFVLLSVHKDNRNSNEVSTCDWSWEKLRSIVALRRPTLFGMLFGYPKKSCLRVISVSCGKNWFHEEVLLMGFKFASSRPPCEG